MQENLNDNPLFHQTLAVASFGDSPLFSDLEKQHELLVRELSIFDRNSCLSVVAGLLTFPQFHGYTIRLETLQSLIHRNASGGRRPGRATLARWINRRLGYGYAWRAEDPVEDVFISNVISRLGNSRIFEGIWEANDFWLQQAINALLQLDESAEIHSIFAEVLALLQLSELLADRCALARYSMGGGATRRPLELPAEEQLYYRASLVRFSSNDLEDARIAVDLLKVFLHEPTPVEGALGRSTLERRPLVRHGGDIIVALPTALSPAIRLHVLDRLIRNNLVANFSSLLTALQDRAVDEGLKRLEGEPDDSRDILPLPEDAQLATQTLCQFDRGKFAHVILCQDSILELSKTGFTGVQNFSDEGKACLLGHLKTSAQILSSRPGYSGGLTVLVVGGLGRSFAFALPTFVDNWYPAIYRLSDFLALGRVQGTTFLRLWKLKQQLSEIRKRGMEVENINGDLNLLGFWWRQGFRLVPKQVAPIAKNLLLIGSDYVAEVRHKLRTEHNNHAMLRRRPNEWVSVQRFHTDSHFKESKNDPIYVDTNSVSLGQLRAAVETQRRAWWLSTPGTARIDWHRELQYRVWEALLHWLLKSATIAEGSFPALPQGPIETLLRFEGLQRWSAPSVDELPTGSAHLETATSMSNAQIRIVIPVPFFRVFAEARNTGERMLIRSVFVGINSLSRADRSTEELDDLVQKVVRNDDARFFHLAFAHNYRHQVAGTHGARPRFISKEDSNFNLLELAFPERESGISAAKKVEGREACNDFLHAVVDQCWRKMREILKKIDRKTLVLQCLENIEAMELDKEQWRLTASALLASHEDKEDVLHVATKRESKRALSQIATRTIVEMAVCTCPHSGGVETNNAAFDSLSAYADILLHAAIASDAQKYEFTQAILDVFPNGEFETDQRYQRDIITPYTSGMFGQEFHEAARSYNDYFKDPRKEDDRTGDISLESKFGKDFEPAFISEFGISPEKLIEVVAAVENDGIKENKLVINKSRQEFETLLKSAELDNETIQNVIGHFALWPRGAWSSTPSEFSEKDWQPWRFRRRLSLIARPFVILRDGTDGELIYAPGFVFSSIGLLLDRCFNGELPSEYFRSALMRSWIGKRNQEHGLRFETTVADQCKTIGLGARASIGMTEFGADASYGNLDVLAWNNRGTFFAIECKRLRAARTVAEIGEQLRAFRGKEKDRLAKHVRRWEWLRDHPQELNRVARTRVTLPNVVSLLVTNTMVPMQFVTNLPLSTNQIVPLSRLAEFVGRF